MSPLIFVVALASALTDPVTSGAREVSLRPPTRDECSVIAAVVRHAPTKDVHPDIVGLRISTVVVSGAGLPADDLRTKVAPTGQAWPDGSFHITSCPSVAKVLQRRRWSLFRPSQTEAELQNAETGSGDVIWFLYRPYIATSSGVAEMLAGNRDNGVKFILRRVGQRWIVAKHRTVWTNLVDALVPAP